MKNVRKVISFILFFTLILSSFTMAFAETDTETAPAATVTTAEKAQQLNSMGLYAGTSPDKFAPDLSGSLSREQGITMLLRILGMEEKAKAMAAEEVAAALKGYKDTDAISSWAKNYIAYAISEKLINGYPDGSIKPILNMTGKMYAQIILKNLGYVTGYDTAATVLSDQIGAKGGISSFTNPNTALLRDSAVELSFAVLDLKPAGSSTTLIQNLVNTGKVSQAAAESAGLIDATPAKEDIINTGSSSHRHNGSNSGDTAVAKPTPSVSGGVYKTDQFVSLTCGTAGSTIYYTMDDTTPSVTSIKYVSGSPIPIEENVKLQAIAVADGKTNSSIMSEKYIRNILLVNENPTTHATQNINLLTSSDPYSPAFAGDELTVTASGVSNLTYTIASGTVDSFGNPISANIDASSGEYIFTGNMLDTILVTVTIGDWTETFTVNIT